MLVRRDAAAFAATVTVLVASLLALSGCHGSSAAADAGATHDASSGHDAAFGQDGGAGGGGGVGASCTDTVDCRSDLLCRSGTCEPIPIGTQGASCTYTAQCMADLYCNRARVCAASGGSGLGDPCVGTADCQMGLVCVGGHCSDAGPGDVGATCIDDASCVAGLFCVDGVCSATPPAMDGGVDGGLVDGGGHVCTTTTDCDDHDACTVDSCVADHCVNTLIDVDMDGYAPTEIGPCGRDCNDNDPTVNPDHTMFESMPHAGSVTSGPSFDWNCDGVIEKRWPNALGPCDSTVGSCGGEGWIGSVPACGTSGTYAQCTSSCMVQTIEAGRVQTCR